MRPIQKLNEINYAFKEVALQPNIWQHLKESIDRIFAPDAIITVCIVQAHISAELTRSALYRFMAIWIGDGLNSLLIEGTEVESSNSQGDTVKCIVRSYMDSGVSQVS
jgi:hypothetical protein